MYRVSAINSLSREVTAGVLSPGQVYADLERVRREGKRVRGTLVEARLAASPLSHPRVGIVVPRYGHTAVRRNQVKRRLREIVRITWLPTLHQPADIVVRALPTAYGASFRALREQMATLLQAVYSRSSESTRSA